MKATGSDIDAVVRIRTAEEAEAIGLAAGRALIVELRALGESDWDAVTVCAPWTVTDMVRHLLGATKGNASRREMVRQLLHGLRHKAEFDGNPLDATNALQVADHAQLRPEALLDELEEVYPASVSRRTRAARFFDRVRVPLGPGGSTASGMPDSIGLGDLLRVIYTRDVWLHRIDIARAVGRRPAMDSQVDRRIIEDVVKEWADRHAEPFDLQLSGDAGGHWVRPGRGPTIVLEAVEFCWILSGRAAPPPGSAGEELLTTRVAF